QRWFCQVGCDGDAHESPSAVVGRCLERATTGLWVRDVVKGCVRHLRLGGGGRGTPRQRPPGTTAVAFKHRHDRVLQHSESQSVDLERDERVCGMSIRERTTPDGYESLQLLAAPTTCSRDVD